MRTFEGLLEEIILDIEEEIKSINSETDCVEAIDDITETVKIYRDLMEFRKANKSFT